MFPPEDGFLRWVPGHEAHARAAAAALEFKTGAKLAGRYTVRRRLGAGATGDVYEVAEDDWLGRVLALKVLQHRWHGDPGAEERFRAEARLTAGLEHANIPPVHDAGRLGPDPPGDDRLYYTMRLVAGGTAGAPAATRHFDPETAALPDFEQVCAAVAYAHTRGVVHRDLKPQNILVGPAGDVFVTDWGVAKVLGAACPDPPGSTGPPPAGTLAGEVLGTPEYMAPEQARGENERVGPPADVFALGAILCQMLTTTTPYQSGKGDQPPADEVLRRARAAELEPAYDGLRAATSDPALRALARTCLAAEPEDRPPDAGAVLARVRAIREARERAPLRRYKRAAGAVAAVAVLVGLALGWARADRAGRRLADGFVDTPEAEPLRPAAEAVRRSWTPAADWLTARHLRADAGRPFGPEDHEPDPHGRRRAVAAAGLVLLDRSAEVWPLLRYGPDQRVRYQLIRRLVTAGVSAGDLEAELAARLDGPRHTDADAGVRQALLLALGLFDAGPLPVPAERLIRPAPLLPADVRGRLLARLPDVYRTDPDPGVHSATEWLLRRWNVDTGEWDAGLARDRGEEAFRRALGRGDDWRWYVTTDGHTMVVFATPNGGPYRFAVSTKEVTFAQFERLVPRVGPPPAHDRVYLRRPACRVAREKLFAYCDELTRREKAGGPFYDPAAGGPTIGPGDGNGYRLPTEDEWAVAARAGTETPDFSGADPTLNPWVAWTLANVHGHKGGADLTAAPAGRLIPNPGGLFDVLGNVGECCHTVPRPTAADPLVARGESFLQHPPKVTAAARSVYGDSLDDHGFRLARTVPAADPAPAGR